MSGARHPWDRGRRVRRPVGAGRSVRVRRTREGGRWWSDGWSESIWVSPARTRCGCWTRTGGRCAGGGASRRWPAWAGSRRRRWPARPAGTVLEVVIEPTGPAWLPVAVFFTARGHRVFRVSWAKAADLRRFLSRHAKSNGIDADTLARLPLVDPAGLHPLELPGAERAALDRRVRAADRLTAGRAEHKVRIKDLVRQLMPCHPADRRAGGGRPGRAGAVGRPAGAAGGRPGPADRADRQGLARPPGRRPGRAVAGGARPPRSSSTASTPPSPTPTWPPRSPPRSGCSAPPRPSWPATPRNARTPTGGPTSASWPAPCPAWREVGGPVLVAAIGRPGRFPTGAALQVLHRA